MHVISSISIWPMVTSTDFDLFIIILNYKINLRIAADNHHALLLQQILSVF